MYTLMIVDDREIFRRHFKRLSVFRDNSRFQVRYEAENGQRALEILRQEKVNIMITDIRMPIMNGLELLKKAREELLCPCIVLLSEYADFSFAKQGIVLGAFDYVVKPIDPAALEELLERCAAHLDADSQGIGGDNVERILPTLILKNDDYADTISRQIASRIVELNKDYPQKIQIALSQLLLEIKRHALKKSPHMELYCDFDTLFELDHSICAEDYTQYFCDKTSQIRVELNKFSVQSKSELIQSVCNMIVKNIESNISLQSAANMHFVNKAYLSHLFKQELGISFVDYMTFVKIERAKKLLSGSNRKIYEISESLGYSDIEYFRRVFKKATGLTATEFRQRGASNA